MPTGPHERRGGGRSGCGIGSPGRVDACFRERGLAIKVSYEAFGEERLKVATPDETDETDERGNRRADCTLSAEGPPSSGTVFK